VSCRAGQVVIQTRKGLGHMTWTHDRRRIRNVVVDPLKLL
jgi:hypothetical protein